jgi:hypothetical protein
MYYKYLILINLTYGNCSVTKVTVTSRILAEELQGNLTQTQLISNKKVILKDVCKTGRTFFAIFTYLRTLCLATMSYLSVVRGLMDTILENIVETVVANFMVKS